MRLRLLFLNWRDGRHPESGGAERYLSVLAEGLAARGHEVTIRTSHYPGALPQETVAGVHYVRSGGRYSIYPGALVNQLIRADQADVVIDVQNGVPYLSPLVRRGPVINLVHHVHKEQWPVVFGPKVSRVGWWLESGLAPAIYRKAEYVAVSESTKRELIQIGVTSQRITVIPNGTDEPPAVDAVRAAHPVVTVLGRLVPQKQVEFAMRSVATLSTEIPDLELRVIGDGYWENRLREEADRLGITDRTVFTGYVSEAEKHRLLAESWVLALPSLKEGWGLVVTEAGIHGTPAVAFSDAGGPTDSIRDDQTGVLVHGGQTEFTEAVRQLLVDHDRRSRLSQAAASWARTFRWEDCVEHWEDLLIRSARP